MIGSEFLDRDDISESKTLTLLNVANLRCHFIVFVGREICAGAEHVFGAHSESVLSRSILV